MIRFDSIIHPIRCNALTINLSTFGDDNPDIVKSYDVGLTYKRKGDKKTATSMFEKAVAIAREEHPKTKKGINNLYTFVMYDLFLLS